MLNTSDFRNGLKIEYQGEPYIIVEFQHVKPGKGNAFTRTKIKNLLSGRVLDPTFKSGEKVGKPDIEEKDMQYLYREGEHYVCMDNTTYEQVVVDQEAVGDQATWLKENDPVSVLFWNGSPITVEVEKHVVLQITHCEPGVRGDTATGASKPATLETGAVVQVPIFINEGENIKVDTRTGSYLERVND
ncbi:MAG: elongation factor P [Myxococcota bacterium]|nr:elongation factor P [Myxococcota bacterium]